MRENRTITVDFRGEATYFRLIADGAAFLERVLAFLLSLGFQLKHKATCRGGGCLTRHSHRVFALGQKLRRFADHATHTAGAANGERIRRWSQDKKAGWYAVLADPQMPVTSTLLAPLQRFALIPSR
jgi:hypothetical protein